MAKKFKVGMPVKIDHGVIPDVIRSMARNGAFYGAGGVQCDDTRILYESAAIDIMGDKGARACITWRWNVRGEIKEFSIWVETKNLQTA